MKKIFMLLAAVGIFASCDPEQEDFSNDGNISKEELWAQTSISLDKAASGQNGNVLTCSTSAPVNVVWFVDGKAIIGNYAWKKLKVGEHVVKMDALCADGTEYIDSVIVNCQEITNPLEKIYIYGDPKKTEEMPITLTSGDAAPGRFSDNEGKGLPYLSDEVYAGKKLLIFEIIEATDGPFIWGEGEGCTARVMTGWWDPVFADNVPVSEGLWELQLTEDINQACSKGKGLGAKDLDILMTRGTMTIKSVYYEE